MASFSHILRNILKLNKNSHPLIYLRRVKYKDLQNLVKFIYQGEVNIGEEDLASFLEVAEELQVKGLSESSKVENDHSISENVKVSNDFNEGQNISVTPENSESQLIKNKP